MDSRRAGHLLRAPLLLAVLTAGIGWLDTAEAAPAPTVTGVSPASGPLVGATVITITGTGFLAGATVDLGGVAATGVLVVSATSITATSAAHVPGAVVVTVTNTDGQGGTLSGGFTHPPPHADFDRSGDWPHRRRYDDHADRHRVRRRYNRHGGWRSRCGGLGNESRGGYSR